MELSLVVSTEILEGLIIIWPRSGGVNDIDGKLRLRVRKIKAPMITVASMDIISVSCQAKSVIPLKNPGRHYPINIVGFNLLFLFYMDVKSINLLERCHNSIFVENIYIN
jgi:hypothetical protein